MPKTIYSGPGGNVVLPDKVLCDRNDGGHLVVNPPQDVWDRCELSPNDLAQWSFLVAATGAAMLNTLPVLAGGCLNYWEAGNWALNERASPRGPKDTLQHRRVHLHIFGRSRQSRDPDWKWGESPKFPDYIHSDDWAKKFQPLTDEECQMIEEAVKSILKEKYVR
jgi:diadenosine tetraphosphate (Ap4A) HIT family hydrolase